MDDRTRNAINSMSSMKSSFAPKRSRNFGRKKESTNSVKSMMKFSFGSTILLRGTWTSQLLNNAIGMQNSLDSILSVFKSIIRSKNFDVWKNEFQLFLQNYNILAIIQNDVSYKKPAIAGIIINKDNKISRSTNIRDRGRPLDIRMNKVKDINEH